MLLKLVFRCGFLYFHFLGEDRGPDPDKKLKNCGVFLEKPRIQEATEAITSYLSARNGKAVVPKSHAIEKLTAEIEGEKIHYSRAGAGRPLLLLHGLLGGSFCWRRNMEALSQRHTVFAVDLPGHGESDAPCHLDCSMPAQAIRVSSLLEHLKLEEVDVVGCSWGGAIAMFLAAQSARCVPWCWQRRSIPGRTLAGTDTIPERAYGCGAPADGLAGFPSSVSHCAGADVWRSPASAGWNNRRLPFAGDAAGKGE